MKIYTAFVMTGIGFTFGIFLGLLIQLPVITLPSGERELNVKIRDIKQNSGNRQQIEIDSIQSSFNKLENLGALGSARKQLSLSNSLSGLKPTLHGVVYPQNNTAKSYLSDQRESGVNMPKTHVNHPDSDLDRIHQNANKGDLIGQKKMKTQDLKTDNNSTKSKSAFNDIVNGIFWSQNIEKYCPKGFSDKSQKDWINKIQGTKFLKMGEGCGRMQNRYMTLKDSSHACARYRLNTDQIQGEIYSYYLGKLLKINNMPPTALKLVNSKSDQWRMVHVELANAQWSDDKVIILTKWINDLQPSYIPFEFRENDRQLFPNYDNLGKKGKSDLCDLVQWSDLIIFDYLTANLDRVVNNMFNKQWNPHMMDSPAHNLETNSDGDLVFFDNESGLFHGYRLLDKYDIYHKSLLKSLCVFRNRTASEIERLYLSGKIGDELHKLFVENEPLSRYVPKIPKKNIKILQQRLGDVYNQIQQCRTKFS